MTLGMSRLEMLEEIQSEARFLQQQTDYHPIDWIDSLVEITHIADVMKEEIANGVSFDDLNKYSASISHNDPTIYRVVSEKWQAQKESVS